MGRDILKIVDSLGRERYQSIIIHAPPEMGPRCSIFGKRLAEQSGGQYVDLLDYFIQHHELSEQIDRFGHERLTALLMDISKGERILVIDRTDFLLDTWRKKERKAFYRMIERQWDSYKPGKEAILVFCLQSSVEIEELAAKSKWAEKRVFSLSDLDDIS